MCLVSNLNCFEIKKPILLWAFYGKQHLFCILIYLVNHCITDDNVYSVVSNGSKILI